MFGSVNINSKIVKFELTTIVNWELQVEFYKEMLNEDCIKEIFQCFYETNAVEYSSCSKRYYKSVITNYLIV